jgi:hypothetical protein
MIGHNLAVDAWSIPFFKQPAGYRISVKDNEKFFLGRE